MPKTKIIISEVEIMEGVTKYCAHIQESALFGLIEVNYTVRLNADGSFDEREFVKVFSTLPPTPFDSDSEAYKQAVNCMAYWKHLETPPKYPKIVSIRKFNITPNKAIPND